MPAHEFDGGQGFVAKPPRHPPHASGLGAAAAPPRTLCLCDGEGRDARGPAFRLPAAHAAAAFGRRRRPRCDPAYQDRLRVHLGARQRLFIYTRHCMFARSPQPPRAATSDPWARRTRRPPRGAPHAAFLTVSTTAAPCAAPPPPFYLLPLAPPARGGLPRSALHAVAHAQQISSSTPPARLRAPAKPRPPCGPHVPTHPPRFQGKQGGILQPPPFWCGG